MSNYVITAISGDYCRQDTLREEICGINLHGLFKER